MEISEKAARMVKHYVSEEWPEISVFGETLYVVGEREDAHEVAQKIVDLQARCEALEAIARDFVRRNANGPLFYRDLYTRFVEVLND